MTGKPYKWTCQNCGRNFKEVDVEEFEDSEGDRFGYVETKNFKAWKCDVCGEVHEIEVLNSKYESIDNFIAGDDEE